MNYKKIILAAWLLLPHAAAFCAAVNIYHTSDTHGFYYPRVIDGRLTGGYAALAGYLAKAGGDYLLLDGGDWMLGTYEAEESKGLLSVEAMNMLGYGASTIGNHEYDFGEAAMFDALRAARFDILAANISAAGIAPYKIYTLSGKKIAVIGLANGPRAARATAAFKRTIARVKKLKPDAVVVLAHFSAEDDDKESKELKAALLKTKSVDVFLGGHGHAVINKKTGATSFVESGAHLKGFSKITLDFDDATGRLRQINSEYVPLAAAEIKPDEAVAGYLEQYYQKDMDTVLTVAESKIAKYGAPGGGAVDSPLGSLIADIIRQYAGAEIALHGTAGMRTDLPAGDVSKRIIFDIFPFPSVIFTARVSGAFLREFITTALGEGASAFQYSGVEVKYSYENKKARSVQITVNGRPLADNKTYTVALTDFTANGNEAGFLFKKVKYKSRYGNETLRQILVEYMRRHPAVSAPPPGRIKNIL